MPESTKKLNRRKSWAAVAVGLLAVMLAVSGHVFLRPVILYKQGSSLRDAKEFARAALVYAALGEYKDAPALKLSCEYEAAAALEADGDYAAAQEAWLTLGDYKNADERAIACRYAILRIRVAEKDWSVREELEAFQEEQGDYQDIQDLLLQCAYGIALENLSAGAYEDAIEAFTALGEYRDSVSQLQEARYRLAASLDAAGDLNGAEEQYLLLGEYKDSVSLERDVRYRMAIAGTDYASLIILANLGDYKDAAAQVKARCLPDLSRAVTLSAGKNHLARLRRDGTVVCVGADDYGQCDTANWAEVVSLAVGDLHTVGLRRDGTVLATGANSQHQCQVNDWKDVVYITAGAYVTMGITREGKLLMTPTAMPGFEGLLTVEEVIQDVAAGYDHGAVLTQDGRVVSAGANSYKQLATEEEADVIALYATDFVTYCIHSDGTVTLIGADGGIRKVIADWTEVKALACSMGLVVGLRKDGTLLSAGRNDLGQLSLENMKGISAIATNGRYVLGLTPDGSVLVSGGETLDWDPTMIWPS
ncbi:MAG: hypothetical protein ACOX17_07460 [Christensenellales bacterium]|jgi:hypothetical protein